MCFRLGLVPTSAMEMPLQRSAMEMLLPRHSTMELLLPCSRVMQLLLPHDYHYHVLHLKRTGRCTPTQALHIIVMVQSRTQLVVQRQLKARPGLLRWPSEFDSLVCPSRQMRLRPWRLLRLL